MSTTNTSVKDDDGPKSEKLELKHIELLTELNKYNLEVNTAKVKEFTNKQEHIIETEIHPDWTSKLFDNTIDSKLDEECREFVEKDNGALLPMIYYSTPSKLKYSKEQLILLLREEDKIRTDTTKLDIFDKEENYEFYGQIDENIRLQALKNKLPELLGKEVNEIDWADAFKAYNLACGEYINDEEVRKEVVWMRYDKTRLGNIKRNDPTPVDGIFVYDFNKNKIPFKSLLSTELPNIVIGGSLT